MELYGLVGDTWRAWRVVAKLLDGLPLAAEEQEIYEACTGRTLPPSDPPAEIYLICGRRSGKSRFAGVLAGRAARRLYGLAPGERAVIGIAAADREQARVLYGYATAPFRADTVPPADQDAAWGALRTLVSREVRAGIEFHTGVAVEIRTAHYGRVRGRTFALALADEAAFWAADDGSNPASEVLAAIRPGLATLHGQLIVVTTPFARSGPVWEAFDRYYGRDDARVLVWRAASRVMNPTIAETVVEDALDRDEAAARAEWLGEFREDAGALLTHERLRAVVVAGRGMLPPVPGVRYLAFCDVASGSGRDAFALAIGHGRDGVAVLDRLEEVRPPFDPLATARRFAEVLRAYRVTHVVGDEARHVTLAVQGFKDGAIDYRPTTRAQTKTELYLNLLAAINAGRVELLDDTRLMQQLLGLQRRAAAGRDVVEDRGRHDDRANVVAGVVALGLAATPPVRATWGRDLRDVPADETPIRGATWGHTARPAPVDVINVTVNYVRDPTTGKLVRTLVVHDEEQVGRRIWGHDRAAEVLRRLGQSL